MRENEFTVLLSDLVRRNLVPLEGTNNKAFVFRLTDDILLLYSYNTLAAIYDEKARTLYTFEKISRMTTKHINIFIDSFMPYEFERKETTRSEICDL